VSAGTDQAAGPRGAAIWPVFPGTPGKGLCGACRRVLPLGVLRTDPEDFKALRCADRAACDVFRAPRPLPRSLKGPGSWLDEFSGGPE
jgi:hypothetical protein